MNANKDRSRINRVLGSYGLGTLEDRGTMAQLGYLVEDHEHFRMLVNKCEPAERVNMYNALRPHLRFQPKPLDVYVSELGDLAERKQLPTIDGDGKLVPFRAPVIGAVPKSDLAIANEALKAAEASKHLQVVCGECTREAVFSGFFKSDCIDALRQAGWVYHPQREIDLCPQCAAPLCRAA